MIKIGHARSSEKGTANGSAGDQTGREVSISDWYAAGWTAIFRPKSTEVAEKIARFIESACTNDHIGYSQDERMTLYYELKKVGMDPAKVSKDCNCDCSSLVAAACIAAGVTVPAGLTTRSEEKALMDSGAFRKIITDVNKSVGLMRGDILHKIGHTAVSLGYGSNKTHINEAAPVCFHRDTYYNREFIIREDCNMRKGASLSAEILKVLRAGYVVRSWGYYNTDERGVNWIYCQITINKITYIGFVSEKVLKRK